MFSIMNIGLKLLGKTKLGKKVTAKVLGSVGKVLGKLGKKKRAGMGNKTSDVSVMAMDRANDASASESSANYGQGIVAGDGEHPVSDTLGDFLGRVKKKAGPIETTVGADKTMIYVGIGAAALIVLGVVMSKR